MARDLNKVMLIGRLGADPEMRYTSSGTAVTSFRLATSRQWRDQNGENREETEWSSVVAWNKLAELCDQYLTKGARVYVEGRLQTRSWEDQQSGQTRYKTEIVINDMILLDSREGRAPRGDSPSQGRPGSPGDIGDEDIPF
jgi:single-strand DNA-binding protein